MNIRRTCLAAAAAFIAVGAAGYVLAETFDETVVNNLRSESALKADMSVIRQNMAEYSAAMREQQQSEKTILDEEGKRGGPTGGGHPAPAPRPAPHPTPHPTPHPNPHPTPHPNPHPTPHPNPGPHPHPGPHPGPHPRPHPGPHPRPNPGDHHHRDWGRWHGHPGWGHRHDRWIWIDERPHWWGWIIWRGERRAECVAYYQDQLGQCDGFCADERTECVQACGQFSDAGCVEQCNLNDHYCAGACEDDYQENVNAHCPAFK